MTITKLNQGYITSPEANHAYHQVVGSVASTGDEFDQRYGKTARGYNEDCTGDVELVWVLFSEASFPGALVVMAEDYSVTNVDTGNIGCCGVAVGNGALSDAIASGSAGWVIVKGQCRIHADDVAAGAALYVDASNPGGVDDAAVTGELVSNAFSMAADVTTSGAYNETTAKCMIAYPKIDSVSPTPA